jgi:hypothetical protein
MIPLIFKPIKEKIVIKKLHSNISRKKRLLCLICAVGYLLTGCMQDTDDPTNIEHEVLRASLLEKELKIDELLKTSDQNSTRISQLETQNTQLERDNKRIQEKLDTLLLNQSVDFLINDQRDNYYQSFNDKLLISGVYNNDSLDIHQEILYLLAPNRPKQELYRGKEITFYLNSMNTTILLLDNNLFYVLDEQGKILFKTTIDLNNPQLDLKASLYVEIDNTYNSASVFLTRDTEIPSDATSENPKKSNSKLQAIVYFDYSNLTDIKISTYYFDTYEYVFFSKKQILAYVKTKAEESVLELLDLRNQATQEIQVNKTNPLDIKVEGATLFYQTDDASELSVEP